jgi:hypothetical protein
MTPIKTSRCTTELRPAAGDEDKVRALPIARHDGGVSSFWHPTAVEMAMLNRGGHVVFTCSSATHPPIYLTTGEMEDPDPSVKPPPGWYERLQLAVIAGGGEFQLADLEAALARSLDADRLDAELATLKAAQTLAAGPSPEPT